MVSPMFFGPECKTPGIQTQIFAKLLALVICVGRLFQEKILTQTLLPSLEGQSRAYLKTNAQSAAERNSLIRQISQSKN